MRALYQRKKGRDLFELAIALKREGVDPERIVKTFATYMEHGGHNIIRGRYQLQRMIGFGPFRSALRAVRGLDS